VSASGRSHKLLCVRGLANLIAMKAREMITRIGGVDEGGAADLPMALLCASAFFTAFSLPVGRICAGLSLLVLIYRSIRTRTPIRFPRTGLFWVLFSVLAAVTVLLGPAPDVGLGKLDKLAWFLTLPLAATLVRGPDRVKRLLVAFALGCTVHSLDVCILRPIEAYRAAQVVAITGRQESFLWHVTDLGGMTDGQILGMGILASLTLLLAYRGKLRIGYAVMLVVQLLALAVNLKRGSWMALGATACVLVLLRTDWRVLVILVVFAVAGSFLPPIHQRLVGLKSELTNAKGGRLVMWTEIAPALLREYPAGVGFRSLTEEMMQETARKEGVVVEHDRNHLHSNIVQITVAMGWAGLVLYLLWMVQGLVDGCRWYRAAGTDMARGGALCVLLMLCFLLLNGIVEYNFADGELVLLYGMIFGMLGGHAPMRRVGA
jgi:hypothetical protein